VRACLPTKLPRMPEKSGFGTSSTAWVLNKSVVRTKFLPPEVELDKKRVLALPILKDWPSSRTLPKPVLASFCPEKHNCEQQEPVYVMMNKREYTTIQGQGPWTPISKFQVFARKKKKIGHGFGRGISKNRAHYFNSDNGSCPNWQDALRCHTSWYLDVFSLFSAPGSWTPGRLCRVPYFRDLGTVHYHATRSCHDTARRCKCRG
jgi:hypothetical protein